MKSRTPQTRPTTQMVLAMSIVLRDLSPEQRAELIDRLADLLEQALRPEEAPDDAR